jgi:hypothetical protein
MPLLRATRDVSASATDAKGKPIVCKKGDVVDVTDEIAAELLGHVHPEFGPLWKSSDRAAVEAEALAQAAKAPSKPANVKPGDEAR